ncbi:hypothetical protein RN001_012353 [Aquatica leii]|uniref:Uncharacterized protein n=1 Tax=Aquatica leii TaxID=1421715 RepID=A0AAN7P765_9COLE|nr:hypothetical protein RN001_012353 [Aquatica leii]
MKNFISLLVLISFVLANDEFLENFQICERSDPKLNECLKEAIQKAFLYIENGVEKFKIPSMQPLELESWTVKATKSLPFDQQYKNGELYNYSTSKIEQVQAIINDDNFSIYINGHVPIVKFSGQYQYDNAVFYGENLTGNGTLLFIEYGNVFLVNMTGRVNRNGNKPTLEIVSVSLEDTVEMMDINIDRLHVELSAQSSDHLSKHWGVIFNELAVGYSEMYAFAFKTIANTIFSQLDYDKLFPK